MPVESPDDLAGFFDPDEFGDEAVCDGLGLTGIASVVHDMQRPGATSNSSMGSFMVGAADMSLSTISFSTPWPMPATIEVEKTLTISTGKHAGDYRVKDIQRDGDIVRLMLNKR